ncbi:phosphofurin acidic cluster sorting protein 2 isoform X2 [Plutella xylostella]|uniref:phosphofurin acidic cluster sorting protein 2 isoform X2 n=1 Tax=Plutella xylostella TaxID=51655 RepID=UPI002032A8E4|nr:phosphofurin acidic cluster sorting protein 2 isoform X2 [Plutella xylostella]
MTEKNKSDKMTNASKPVPMKLFAAWEVDRTPSNCIPRLCTLRITRLRVCGSLGDAGGGAGAGAGAVILAARMHSSKRTLRSNDIVIPPMDVELDLCFSLQYPHFVKRDGNKLQIMLQRRKKYKNRTILGYKTLAEGVIKMDQVLQRSMDTELELHSVRGKAAAGAGAGGQPVARLGITGLASTPVDHDTKNNNTMLINERGYSDEEEEGEFSSMEEADDVTYGERARRRTHCRQLEFNKTDMSYTKLSRNYSSKQERDSDSEVEDRNKRAARGKLAQRNLKQKFAALLRRFRVPEELGERGAARGAGGAQRDIDELFQELESLSCGEGDDSGPDQMDTISIGSTPKPSIRPFFSSSRSLATQKHQRMSNDSVFAATRQGSLASTAEVVEKRSHLTTDSDGALIPDERSDGASDGDAPEYGPAARTSPPADQKPRRMAEQVRRLLGDEAPDAVALAPPALAPALLALHVPALLAPPHEPRAAAAALLAACNKPGRRMGCRVLVCGGDAAVAAALRAHVELSPRRPPDVPSPRFHLVPAGPNTVCRYLCSTDAGYAALFGGEAWAALSDGAGEAPPDAAELSARIARYLNSIGPVTPMPIGEAMLAYRERNEHDDASQTFVPFLAEVRVCSTESSGSVELEEGSPPAPRGSPPATPAPAPDLDLQLDYWPAPGWQADGADGKVTVKAQFRALTVTRHGPHLAISYTTKEKKQKIMRLGKKREKGSEAEPGRAQAVDGVARLICSAKGSHNAPLKVFIDGTEWNGVKFFQLSTQWQTHVKTFPVATSGAPLAPPET